VRLLEISLPHQTSEQKHCIVWPWMPHNCTDSKKLLGSGGKCYLNEMASHEIATIGGSQRIPRQAAAKKTKQ
jgi:hypothetical protein